MDKTTEGLTKIDRNVTVSFVNGLKKLGSQLIPNDNVISFVVGLLLGVVMCRLYYWYRRRVPLLETPDFEECLTATRSRRTAKLEHCSQNRKGGAEELASGDGDEDSIEEASSSPPYYPSAPPLLPSHSGKLVDIDRNSEERVTSLKLPYELKLKQLSAPELCIKKK